MKIRYTSRKKTVYLITYFYAIFVMETKPNFFKESNEMAAKIFAPTKTFPFMKTSSFSDSSRRDKVRESYMVVFFDIMYCLLFVPFRVKKDTKTGEYILQHNVFQKVKINLKFV